MPFTLYSLELRDVTVFLLWWGYATTSMCVLNPNTGASNCNGQPVFNCVPYQGKIESGWWSVSCKMKLAIGLCNQCHNYYVTSVAGETQEITINFSPDHESPFYVDVLHIELNGQVHAFVYVYTLCLVPN